MCKIYNDNIIFVMFLFVNMINMFDIMMINNGINIFFFKIKVIGKKYLLNMKNNC